MIVPLIKQNNDHPDKDEEFPGYGRDLGED